MRESSIRPDNSRCAASYTFNTICFVSSIEIPIDRILLEENYWTLKVMDFIPTMKIEPLAVIKKFAKVL